jgi:hypothetical protein
VGPYNPRLYDDEQLADIRLAVRDWSTASANDRNADGIDVEHMGREHNIERWTKTMDQGKSEKPERVSMVERTERRRDDLAAEPEVRGVASAHP